MDMPQASIQVRVLVELVQIVGPKVQLFTVIRWSLTKQERPFVTRNRLYHSL